MDTPKPIIQAFDLKRSFHEAGRELHVLRGVDLTLNQGEWLTILGRSGSGKSTLLHLLGGLLSPSAGSLSVCNQDLGALRGHARKRLGPAVAPREIVFRESLPKTRSGKIMRRLLKARELGLPEGDISTLETDEK